METVGNSLVNLLSLLLNFPKIKILFLVMGLIGCDVDRHTQEKSATMHKLISAEYSVAHPKHTFTQ